jgi:tetratricopeptide (TPR) repeat protein
MLPRLSILSVILMLASSRLQAQDIDMILKKIRDHQFSETATLLNQQKKTVHSPGKAQLLSELEAYLLINREGGLIKDNVLNYHSVRNPGNDTVRCMGLLNQGLYGLLYIHSDEVSFQKLTQALKLAQKIRNLPLICESLKAIELYYSRLMSLQSDDFFYYYELHLQNVYDDTEDKIAFLQYMFYKINSDKYKVAETEAERLRIIRASFSSDYYNRMAEKILALYEELVLRNPVKALEHYRQSIIENPVYGVELLYNQHQLSNYANFLNGQKKYADAIRILKNIHKNYRGRTSENLMVYVYSNLSNAYAGIGKYDSAYIYKEKSRVLKNTFEEGRHNAIIIQLGSQDKDFVISKLRNNKTLYLTTIGLVFVLAFYSFVRWKKLDYRKKKLALEKLHIETEYSQTIEELTKVKELIIEDHVLLKNKTKIYLKELLYIKSDDHYLQVFTTKKKEFIRGKMSDILNQLPPNFVKCHRSYIINKNFVKYTNNKIIMMEDGTEIPFSRGFKLED